MLVVGLCVSQTVMLPSGMPLATGVAWAQPAHAPVAGDIVQITTSRSKLEIAERFAKVLQFPRKILRVDGFDPAVLSVTALAHDQLRVQGITEGITTLVITDENNVISTIDVMVAGDARLLQAVLRREYPNTSVTVTKLKDNVLLRGWVVEPQQITEIVDIAKLYYPNVLNQMKMGGPQQVQLRCKVMEVQRSKMRALGFNFSYLGRNVAFSSTPGTISPLDTLSLPIGGPPGVGLAQSGLRNATMSLGIVGDDFAFGGLLEALREEGLLKIQAEPTIVTRSGEPAKIVSGGEFPIPVPQGLGTIAIEWREFGVRLESVPMILSPNRLKQTIIAEVSERDLANAVTLNSTTVPGLTKRTVETQVEMNFGQTLAIGGLISSRKTAQTSKIPFLGELPWVGAAFRRVNYDEAETELLVLITPEFVAGMDPSQVPDNLPGTASAVPTDRELFGQGVIEVPNYGDPCPNCGPGGAASTPPGLVGPGLSPIPSNYPLPGPSGLITPGGPLPPPPSPGMSDPGLMPTPLPTNREGATQPFNPEPQSPTLSPGDIPAPPGVTRNEGKSNTSVAAGSSRFTGPRNTTRLSAEQGEGKATSSPRMIQPVSGTRP
jgi:pilus assembly protein CpaC